MKLPQEQVIAAVQTQGVTGSVGPTSRKGWTALWTAEVEESDLARYGAQYLAIDETPDGLQMDVLLGVGGALRQVWPYSHGTPTMETGAMAGGLTELFDCPDRQRDLEELLRGGPFDPEELVESLDSLLDLPELYEPTPAVSVVAYRGAHKIARFAATLAGPALVCAEPDGWTILLASGEDETRSIQLAAGLSGAAGRRDLVLDVWRDGSASGGSLWSRGKPVADWSWNARWLFVDADSLGVEALTVRRLVKALGHPADESLLRALLRNKHPYHDPLAELVTLLSLPIDLLVALDNPERFHESAVIEDIAKTSVRRAVLQGASGGFDADGPPRWPALSTVYAIGTVLAAAGCVAMAVLGIAVLVTNGAAVDQSRLSRDDWTLAVMFAAFSLVLVPTAVVRARRARRRRQT